MSQVFQLTSFPIKPGSLVLRSADGLITYTRGVDYNVDEATGRVTWLNETPPVQIRSSYDVLASKPDFEPVIHESLKSINIYQGTYDRQLTVVKKPSYIDISHPSWEDGGEFYVYYDDTDELVLDGDSYPQGAVRICKLTIDNTGTITNLSDDRIYITVSGGGSFALDTPILLAARTNTIGSEIILDFSKEIVDPTGKHNEFKFTSNGVLRGFSKASLGDNSKQIKLTVLDNFISYSQTIYVYYTQGTIKSTDNNLLDSFIDFYVANRVPAEFLFVGGSLTVVNTANNDVVDELQVYENPKGICHSFDNKKVLVVQQDSNKVLILDSRLRTILKTINVGQKPQGICSLNNDSFVYVTNKLDNTVSVINTMGNSLVTTIEGFNEPYGCVASKDDAYVFVVNKGGNNVSIIDTNTNEILSSMNVGDDPSYADITIDNKLYVSNSGDNTVKVIDLVTRVEVATIPVGFNPQGIKVSPLGDYVVVVNKHDNNVSIISTVTNSVVNIVDVEDSPVDLDFKSTGLRLYVSNNGNGTVSVIDMLSLTLIDTINVGGSPSGLVSVILDILLPEPPLVTSIEN